jgi:hypothetical protein
MFVLVLCLVLVFSFHFDLVFVLFVLCIFVVLFLQPRLNVCGLGTLLCQYLRFRGSAAFYVVRWIPCYGFLSVA